MKKVVLILALAAFTFSGSFTAINAATTSTEVTAQATDWDTILKNYDSYVTKYIAAYKKAQAGDPTAMAEMAKLLKQAEKLQAQLEAASDDMTPEQMQKYMKITQKLANAMQ